MTGSKVLLDTHIALWAITDDKKLSDVAREILLDPENEIYISVVSVWEISLKRALHPKDVTFSAQDFSRFCQESGYISLPLTEYHVFKLSTLSRQKDAPPHKDPFDRMLIAQAKTEKMLFLTHDLMISFYNEDFILKL